MRQQIEGLSDYQRSVALMPRIAGGSPVAIPLIEPLGGLLPGTDPSPTAGAVEGPSSPPVEASGSSRFSLGLTSGEFAHADNTSTHVAILVAIALGVIVLLHVGGFRFAVDAGVTRF